MSTHTPLVGSATVRTTRLQGSNWHRCSLMPRASPCMSLSAQPPTMPPAGPCWQEALELAVATPRLQKIVHRNDGAEETCTERDGWCFPKTNDDLRDAMSVMIRQAIRSKRPGESSG